jgi:N-ethylmaleimide reductase
MAATMRAPANAAIAHGESDLIAFGVPFLANPDLPLRYLKSAPLNAPDFATFYAGEEKGYVDYLAFAGGGASG